MKSDTTMPGAAVMAGRTEPTESGQAARAEKSAKVGAIIRRRAKDANVSDAAYFREIIAGRAPRITHDEAAREPLPEETLETMRRLH